MTNTGRMELMGLSTDEITQWCVSAGFPGYRGKQLADWIYRKSAHAFDEMVNLPLQMRQRLEKFCTLTRSKVTQQTSDKDGAAKHLHELADGETVESVFLPYTDRVGCCVSTQVGCPVRCSFCATGIEGFKRNLTRGEIVDQVLTAQELHQRRVSHVVFMGMGEPLLNFEETVAAVGLINSELGISARRITVSTVGIIPGIERLAKAATQVTLAVSLHAANDELREKLIPYARKYPLAKLMKTCKEYAEVTGRRLTFEYLLISGVNDKPEHAVELARLIDGINGHVNLIPCNPVEGLPYKRSSGAAVGIFRALLERNGVAVTQRLEKGASKSAACGQLRQRSSTKKPQD